MSSSAVGSFLRFFGSIKLAMLLLIVIIVATIIGTLVESKFDANVAQAYVYDAPWFIAWLFLLCVNLVGAVLVRYPWKAHQIGFIITHGGMVVILIGGIIGRIWGMEGSITLSKESAPRDFLVANELALQVKLPAEPLKSFPLRLNLRDPSPERPFRYEAGDVKVAVLGVSDQMGIQQIIEPGPSGPPAVRLVATGGGAPHPIDRWLVQDHPQRGTLAIGPNVVRFARQAIPHEQAPAGTGSREIHFAFAKMSGANVTRVLEGTRSGAAVDFSFPMGDSESRSGSLLIKMNGQEIAFPISELEQGNVVLPGTEWTLQNLRYFPDFRMEAGAPVSVSNEPNNPAVYFELAGPAGHTEGDDCCPPEAAGGNGHDPHGAPAPTQAAHPPLTGHEGHAHAAAPVAAPHSGGGNRLQLRFEGGQFHYESRTPEGEESGVLAVGENFAPWPGWELRLEEVIEKAVVREELGPVAGTGARSNGSSGLHVRFDDGENKVEKWVEMGTTTLVSLGGKRLHVAFGRRLHPLDFTVALERFEVEFNSGTQTPSSFKSHVVFKSKSGEELSRAIWMNNPANFPNFTGAGLLGTTYKFSQSSWNPNDLNQTTLQVIRDPGWSLKWIGSLLFCAGLVTVFYLKPYPRFTRPEKAESHK